MKAVVAAMVVTAAVRAEEAVRVPEMAAVVMKAVVAVMVVTAAVRAAEAVRVLGAVGSQLVPACAPSAASASLVPACPEPCLARPPVPALDTGR
jgi:hypothetical protein